MYKGGKGFNPSHFVLVIFKSRERVREKRREEKIRSWCVCVCVCVKKLVQAFIKDSSVVR